MSVQRISHICRNFLLLLPCVAPAFAGETLFEETELFVGGQDNVNTYRIPSMIATSKGTVLVFCEARKNNNIDGSPTDLVLKRSLDNSGSWNPPRRLGPVPDGRSRHRNLTWLPMQILIAAKDADAFMNPVPVVDRRDGAIYLLVNYHQDYGKQKDQARIWLLKSADEGASWTAPVDITPDVGPKPLGPGIGIQMRNGRLVVPTYEGVIFSDDHGTTWMSGGRTTGPVNETQVVELTDGSLMLNTRGAPYRTVTMSGNGGITWGESSLDRTLTDSAVYGGCQASIIRYTRKDDSHDKDRLLFASPADPNYRFHLTVRVSYDEGRTWPVAKLIKKGTGAYSSLTVFPDHTIGLVYETGNDYGGIVEYYSKISFARFNLEWLTGGQDQIQE